MNKITSTLFACLFAGTVVAQEGTTNAFLDLQRKGEFTSQVSVMQTPASEQSLQKLLSEKPKANYFVFAEERNFDIAMKDQIPQRWTERSADDRLTLNSECAPGEYFTYQLGVYAPYQNIESVNVVFGTLKNAEGQKLNADQMECFNLGGINTSGKRFTKDVSISKGKIQPLWIGVEIPSTAKGTYTGYVTIKPKNAPSQKVAVSINIQGNAIANSGDNEGWRKTRLRWLNSTIGVDNKPTAPYIPLTMNDKQISYLGGTVELGANGLPTNIVTHYNQSNLLDTNSKNNILSSPMEFVVETSAGIATFQSPKYSVIEQTQASIKWQTILKNKNIELQIIGTFNYDGLAHFNCVVKSLKDVEIKDIRLEVPYTQYASKYMMGLGHKGGYRSADDIAWNWDVKKHQDKIWMGNVNAGLNFVFMDENYKRPLVNVYYSLGQINLPASWGNQNKGGITIKEQANSTMLKAYSGERSMKKGEVLNYNFNMLITPVKPLNMPLHATERFYHSNSDLSSRYIEDASKVGATAINIHHKKEIYPFINYPFYDESVADLKTFAQDAAKKGMDMRLYYTTRELTVKIPELWALHSLNGEVIFDGPGKDTRTLIHQKGPHQWLIDNLKTNFIPAWYNAFNEGKYKGDMDLSVITTPDSRWNNYYLAGLDWMIKNIDLNGVYIDDSALDRITLQRARRILDADGNKRLIDIHSWNHNNQWAGYANSLHIYLELLPYVDRTWMGEGFPASNTHDFWLIEMSGIPFGLLSESLDAHGSLRGMAYAMLPRIPWSGNPKAMWDMWDEFGMKDAELIGYWDERNPIVCESSDVRATVYRNSKTGKMLVALSNWTDTEQTASFKLKNGKQVKATPAIIKGIQDGSQINTIKSASGAFFIVEE